MKTLSRKPIAGACNIGVLFIGVLSHLWDVLIDNLDFRRSESVERSSLVYESQQCDKAHYPTTNGSVMVLHMYLVIDKGINAKAF